MSVDKIKMANIIVFCSILFGFSFIPLFLPQKEYSVLENRELAGKPDFTAQKFIDGEYQKQYENYLNDRFFMRDGWVSLSAVLQSAMGKRDINEVYIGKDSYLLEKGSSADEEQVEENIGILSKFLNETADIYGPENVKCMMIPSKTSSMPDKLPAFAKIEDHSEILNLLKGKLSHQEMFIDLGSEMKKHQDEYIYYRTDHHWTTLGAYYAYAVFAGENKRPLEHYKREAVFDDFYGTTYNKVHLTVPRDTVELFHSPGEEGISVNMDDGELKADTMYFIDEAKKGFNRYNVFFSKNTFKIELNTKSDSKKTLLMIKDSFANCFVPFLTEDYKRIIMIDYRYGKVPIGKIMSEYKDITDVIVLFNTEKFMENTKLAKLADTKMESSTMEEFNLEDFLE